MEKDLQLRLQNAGTKKLLNKIIKKLSLRLLMKFNKT
jgi:hypothetical protein